MKMDTEAMGSAVLSPITLPTIGVQWLPAVTILHNEVYGKYMAASRIIPEGELIMDDVPLIISPLGVPNSGYVPWNEHAAHDCAALIICVSCGKPLQDCTTCSKCHWPVCDQTCENDVWHSNGECPIFGQNGVHPETVTLGHYTAIVVLRTLLFMKKNPSLWNYFQNLESHREYRRSCSVHSQELQFVTAFLREKCNLTEYDSDRIEHVRDCLEINTFWSYPDLPRYMYMFCEKGCFITHDCNPNCDYISVEKEMVEDGVKKTVLCLEIRAKRLIQPNEPITICYVIQDHDSTSVTVRQHFLQAYYHFQCTCKLCTE